MTELRTGDGVRDRIDRYLRESGLGGDDPRVVPLTGDASDRKYFRIIPADGPSIVLALHAGAIDFATLPFANVGTLLQQIPLPVPGILGHSDPLGIVALAGSRRRHAAGAPRRGIAIGARGAVPAGGGADRAAAAARRRAPVRRVPAVRHRVRRRQADLGAGFLREAFRRRLSRLRLHAAGADGARRRVGVDRRPSWRASRGCCAIATTTAAT